MVTVSIDVQRASSEDNEPSDDQVHRWVHAALAAAQNPSATLTVRFVDEAEMSSLNMQFRGRHGPTNVLSFPFEAPPGLPEARDEIGDIVVCVPLVQSEAISQGKSLGDHFAHLIVHGVLHLHGYDHQEQDTADIMEALETAVLASLNIADPYREITA